MRRTVRVFSQTGPEERLGRAIASLPSSAVAALGAAAEREDLPLVAGHWEDSAGGCLVANVVRAVAAGEQAGAETLDVRVLRLLPELSSRDLNRLIVAWDEAAEQEGRSGDAALRRLLRGALAWAARHGEPATASATASATAPATEPATAPAIASATASATAPATEPATAEPVGP